MADILTMLFHSAPAVLDEENLPSTPPSEYGDQPDDPDAGVYEREPEPPEGLDAPADPDECKGE